MKASFFFIIASLFFSSFALAQTNQSGAEGIDVASIKESIAETNPTEEDLLKMYGADTNALFQKMQAEIEKIEKQTEEAEASRKLKRNIALFFSLLIAFFPAISVYRLVRKKKITVSDKSNILPAVLILLLGGAILFVFNYFRIWMSLTHGTKFYAVAAVLLMIVIAAWAIWEYFKKPKTPLDKKEDQNKQE